MASSTIKQKRNCIPDFSNGTVINTPVSDTDSSVHYIAPEDGLVVIDVNVSSDSVFTVRNQLIHYLPTTSIKRFHSAVPVGKGDDIGTHCDDNTTIMPIRFYPNRRGRVNARLLRDLLSGGLHDKHYTKTDKRIGDIYSTIHDACKHTGQAIQLINSEWMGILSNNTMFISDVGRISVSNRHKFVNRLSYSHRGCINTRQRFSRSLYGVQVTTLSREEVAA